MNHRHHNTFTVRIAVVMLSGVVFTFACGTKAEPAAGNGNKPVQSAAGSQTAAPKPQVTKIIFIDKENACDCTRKAIAKVDAQLKTALQSQPAVTVERYMIDTQELEVEKFKVLNPIMALPALYFLDSTGKMAAFLQGEVTAEQISRILKGE